MLSVVVMAALSIAPEANGNVFKRGHHAAPAACCGAPAPAPCCGAAPAAPCEGCAPTAPAGGGAAPTTLPPVGPAKTMPKGDAPKADAPKADAPKADAPKAVAPKADAPKGDAPKVLPPIEKKTTAVEAPIEIPANLKAAIDKSDKKSVIMEYLNNPLVPREDRIRYLETDVRPNLLPDSIKK